MPTSHLLDHPSDRRLLELARVAFLRMGMTPLHYFTQLVERGFIVTELEEQWAQEPQ